MDEIERIEQLTEDEAETELAQLVLHGQEAQRLRHDG